MSIFTNIKSALDERRRKKLRGDLLMIQKSEFEFNPFKTAIPKKLLDIENDNLKLVENLVWYSADGDALFEFYNSHGTKSDKSVSYKQSFFWTTCPPDYRHVHSGLPALISQKMSIILFNSGIDIDATVYKKDSEGNISNQIDKKASERATEVIKLCLDKIDFADKLDLSGQSESWSGHIAWKFNYDFSISPLPIIEVYDRRYFDVIKKRGITTAIVFKEFFEKHDKGNNKKQYVLEENYSTNEEGNATIDYHLFEFNPNGERREVPLTTFEEYADLEPRVFKTKGMIAFDKPNLLLAKSIHKSPYGKSDYFGAVGSFDSLDEIVTQIVGEIRDNKTIRQIPDDMWPVDEDGNFKKLNKYITNFVKSKYDPDNPQDIKITDFTDKTDQHEKKYKILVAQACNNAGLSPISLGITGLESIDSSDKSTRERSKTTTETRKAKIKLWKPFLEKVILQLLAFTSELQESNPPSANSGIPRIYIDYSNANVNVSFADYITDSIDSKVTTWGLAKTQNIASIEMVVNKIHENDLTDEEKKEEINRIRFEQGMTVDNPSLLQLAIEEDEGQENPNGG